MSLLDLGDDTSPAAAATAGSSDDPFTADPFGHVTDADPFDPFAAPPTQQQVVINNGRFKDCLIIIELYKKQFNK